MPEAESLHIAAQTLGADPETDLDRADVARLDDDVSERKDAVVIASILAYDVGRSEAQLTRVGVDERRGRHHVLFERGGGRDDFEGRTWLVEILDGTIAPVGLVEFAVDVRIERRLIGHREDLAGVRAQDDGAPAGGAILEHALVQLPFGYVLQVLVDRQLDRGAR